MLPPVDPREPEVLRLLREYRKALDAMDVDVMDHMAEEWLKAMNRLETDMELLAREMLERKANGTAITEQMILLDKRYQDLQTQMQAAIKKYSGFAAETIGKNQLDSAFLGLTAARDSIITQTDLTFHKLDLKAVETMAGFLKDGSPLSTLLANAIPDAVDGLRDALLNGIARGSGVKTIVNEMVNGSGMGLERAVLIARTEVARTYREASLQQYRESGVVSGFKRMVKKETACLACLMLDGEILQTDDDLDDHPGGKCTAVPIVEGTKGPQWEAGLNWFERLDPSLQEEKLGAQRYELWKEGAFELKDLVKFDHSSVYGYQPRVATLAELSN